MQISDCVRMYPADPYHGYDENSEKRESCVIFNFSSCCIHYLKTLFAKQLNSPCKANCHWHRIIIFASYGTGFQKDIIF